MSDFAYRGFGHGGGGGRKSYNEVATAIMVFASTRSEFRTPSTLLDDVVPPFAQLSSNTYVEVVTALREFIHSRGINSEISDRVVRAARTWDEIAQDIFKKQKPDSGRGSGGGHHRDETPRKPYRTPNRPKYR